MLEWIRQQPQLKSLSVVMFSNSSELKDVEKARRLGADDYLVKPMHPSELDQLVKTIRDRWLLQPVFITTDTVSAATACSPASE